MTHTPTFPAVETAKSLGDVHFVAGIYDCSTRTIYRMSDGGKIPRPVRIGGLVRWRLRTGDPDTGILDHIEAGCPPIRRTGK